MLGRSLWLHYVVFYLNISLSGERNRREKIVLSFKCEGLDVRENVALLRF